MATPNLPSPDYYKRSNLTKAHDKVKVTATRSMGMVSKAEMSELDDDFLAVMIEELTGDNNKQRGQNRYLTDMHNGWAATRNSTNGSLNVALGVGVLMVMGSFAVGGAITGSAFLAGAVIAAFAWGAKIQKKNIHSDNRIFKNTSLNGKPWITIYKDTDPLPMDKESIYNRNKEQFRANRNQIIQTQKYKDMGNSVDMMDVYQNVRDTVNMVKEQMGVLEKSKDLPFWPAGQKFPGSAEKAIDANHEKVAKLESYLDDYAKVRFPKPTTVTKYKP